VRTTAAIELPLGRSDDVITWQPGQVSAARTERRRALRRCFAACLALLTGGLILSLAVPRMLASAWLASRDPVIEQMDAGEGVSKSELLGLIASREIALSWVADRDAHDERATALAQLAFRGERQSATERTILESAVEATRAGLALAPADPKDWMQLGYLLVLLDGGPNRSTAEALLASMRTGAFEAPDFMRRRLFWSLAHWAFYDERERRQINDQIRLIWRVAPGELADLALHVPSTFVPIASALDEDAGARDIFLAAVAFATPISAAG
jgi:hypothetical protein